MNYALGCAFNLDQIFYTFPLKKLKLTCKESHKYFNDPNRLTPIKRIFRECYRLVIDDIIDNNVTFHLPTRGIKCDMHMKRFEGDEFKHLRKAGKWADVDFINSFFCGYLIGFYMYGKRIARVKNVYLSKPYTKRITENTNKGMQYGDSNKDKCVKDYYEEILAKFPQICMQDIKRILNYCWKMLYLHNSYGGDVVIQNDKIWSYIGFLKCNALDHYYYYIKKLSVKIRVLYRKKKIPWDGYYYFALTKKQYDECYGTKRFGRPKSRITFKNILLYLILDECRIQLSLKPYILRIPYIDTVSFKFFVKKLETNKAELVMVRKPMKFKDILIYDNEYEYL